MLQDLILISVKRLHLYLSLHIEIYASRDEGGGADLIAHIYH